MYTLKVKAKTRTSGYMVACGSFSAIGRCQVEYCALLIRGYRRGKDTQHIRKCRMDKGAILASTLQVELRYGPITDPHNNN